jgi:hypothetical protein
MLLHPSLNDYLDSYTSICFVDEDTELLVLILDHSLVTPQNGKITLPDSTGNPPSFNGYALLPWCIHRLLVASANSNPVVIHFKHTLLPFHDVTHIPSLSSK